MSKEGNPLNGSQISVKGGIFTDADVMANGQTLVLVKYLMWSPGRWQTVETGIWFQDDLMHQHLEHSRASVAAKANEGKNWNSHAARDPLVDAIWGNLRACETSAKEKNNMVIRTVFFPPLCCFCMHLTSYFSLQAHNGVRCIWWRRPN